jgi:hypothetical protein
LPSNINRFNVFFELYEKRKGPELPDIQPKLMRPVQDVDPGPEELNGIT